MLLIELTWCRELWAWPGSAGWCSSRRWGTPCKWGCRQPPEESKPLCVSWPNWKTRRCRWQGAEQPAARTGWSTDPEHTHTQFTITPQGVFRLSYPCPSLTHPHNYFVENFFRPSRFHSYLPAVPQDLSVRAWCRTRQLLNAVAAAAWPSKVGSPFCSQRAKVQALMSVSICWCALEQDAESLPVPGVSDLTVKRSVGRENFPCRDQ